MKKIEVKFSPEDIERANEQARRRLDVGQKIGQIPAYIDEGGGTEVVRLRRCECGSTSLFAKVVDGEPGPVCAGCDKPWRPVYEPWESPTPAARAFLLALMAEQRAYAAESPPRPVDPKTTLKELEAWEQAIQDRTAAQERARAAKHEALEALEDEMREAASR